MKTKLKYFLEREDLAGASEPLRHFQAVLQNEKALAFPKCPDESYMSEFTHIIYTVDHSGLKGPTVSSGSKIHIELIQ